MGRPAKADINDPKVVERICDELIAGKGMTEICAAKDMPAKSTVYLKMAQDEEFRSIITRARKAQQDAEIDRTIEMADAATAEDWQVVRLRIWARQWRAAKLAPKTYGDSTSVKHEGGVTVNVVTGVSREPGQLSKRGGYDDAGEDE